MSTDTSPHKGAIEEHLNVMAYRGAAGAFQAGDLQTIRDTLVTDDLVWHAPGNNPLAGDIRGAEALGKWRRQVAGPRFWFREYRVFGNDEHVCALNYIGAKRDGVDVETRVVSIFHFEDARQKEPWFYPEDPDAWYRIFT